MLAVTHTNEYNIQMKQKYRKALFISSLLIFFILAPILIFRSQGYRFDVQNRQIIQTGGFYFEVLPKQVSIYLNNNFSRKTDFFFNSTLVENLLPKKYNVKITKDNYISWEKNLEIREKEVTEAKDITLFPQEFDFTIISEEIKNFWVSPSEEKIVWKEINNSTWDLKLYDLKKELKSHLISEDEISRNDVDITNLEFSQNGEIIYLETITSEQLKNYSLNINKGLSSLKETNKPQIQESIIAYQSFNNENYYLDNEGYLYRTKEDLSEQLISNKEKINNSPLPIQKETPYQLYVFPDLIFLKEDSLVYLFNVETKSFDKFSENIKDFKISPDLKTIAYFFDTEIWILPIEKTKLYEAKKSIFLVRFSNSIQDVFWVNSNYIAFSIGDNIKISEIDNRDQLNIIDLGEFRSPKIFWSPISKKIYNLTEETLWQSKELIP